MENFVALSTILLTYSLTELVNGYGFLAVFVAGLVVQHSYKLRKATGRFKFTEEIEKLLEVGTILPLVNFYLSRSLIMLVNLRW